MRKLTLQILVFGLSILFVSCLSNEEKKKKAEEEGNAMISIKSKLLKGAGDALKGDGKEAVESASEGIGEVIKGISSGYDKSINQAKVLSDTTFAKTFEIGRTEKQYSDTAKLKKVTVYLITKEAYHGQIRLKAFNQDNTEIGRSSLDIEMDVDEAKFFDFEFDKRTPLLQADYFTISKK